MPKRATHTFESDKDGAKEEQPTPQYCMCCGEQCLILGPGVALADMPRRRTDGAIVLEHGKVLYKLKSKPGETKVLKREGGYERQYRFGCWNCGVRIGYRAEDSEDAPFTYLLSDATGAQADLYLQLYSCPRSIQETGEDSVRVALETLCGQTKRAIRAVEDTAVQLSVVAPATEGLANAEALDYLGKVLALPRAQLQLSRGLSNRTKFLMVSGIDAMEVFKRLKAAVETDVGPVDAVQAAMADPAGEFSQPNAVTAGAASHQARRAWEMSEEVDELAAAPTIKQQAFIK